MAGSRSPESVTSNSSLTISRVLRISAPTLELPSVAAREAFRLRSSAQSGSWCQQYRDPGIRRVADSIQAATRPSMVVSSVRSAAIRCCAPTSSTTPNAVTPWSGDLSAPKCCPRRRAMARQRRANGEGGIAKRKDGSWMARYTVQTPTGRKRKVIYAKSHEEARKKLAEAIAERDKGLVYDSGNVTLG